MKIFIAVVMLLAIVSAETTVTITNPTEGAVLDVKNYLVLAYDFTDPAVGNVEYYMEFYGLLPDGTELSMRIEPIGAEEFMLGRHDFTLLGAENTSDQYFTRIRLLNYEGNFTETVWTGPQFTIVNDKDPCSPPSSCNVGNNLPSFPDSNVPSLPPNFGPPPTLEDPNPAPSPSPSSASSRLRPFWF